MEGYFTALIFSGAAWVSTTAGKARYGKTRLVLHALSLVGAVVAVVAIVYGLALYEWLTVSWAVGLCACCLGLALPVGWQRWHERITVIVVLTLASIGSIMSAESLVSGASWAIAQAVEQIDYRERTRFVMLGNGLLNLTALVITVRRLRRQRGKAPAPKVS